MVRLRADFGEFAVSENDRLGRPLRQESATRARFAADADGAALRAFEQARTVVFAPLRMRRTLGVTIWIERPFDRVFHKPVPKHRARVIEHDGVVLARGRAQDAADHLPEQTHLAGRTREDAARHFRHIPTFGEHHAIGDKLDLAGRQSLKRCVALGLRRRAVDMFGADCRT